MKTDRQLQQDVMAELAWEPSIDASEIGVTVKDGVVTLTGQVGSYQEKWGAERAAQGVVGLRGLAVDVEVSLSGDNQRSDADIARTAENVLLNINSLPPNSIKVMVENGWITLTGEVPWQQQKRVAVHAVRLLMGVIGVSDQIAIRLVTRADSILKADVEAALKRRFGFDVLVNVTEGHDIVLDGTVPTWHDRQLATQAAWGTSGVQHVLNNILVSD